MKPSVSFFANGDPKGQPRPRAFARNFGGKWQARVYDAGTAEAWKGAIASAAQPFLTMFEGPVALNIRLDFKRPKVHLRSNGQVKESSPLWHTSKPDCDNAAKAVMDAIMQLGFVRDDAQIVRLDIRKTYCLEGCLPGGRIEICEVEATL